jgi:4-amino-4-deoxy-L-arabinose transferase-like glycosyltransferase
VDQLGYYPWVTFAILGLGVWVVYVVDRLVDVAVRGEASEQCEARHLFHWRHRRWFKIGAVLASLLCIALVVLHLPIAVFSYLLVLGLLIGGYFAMALFSNPRPHDVSYAKNLLAGGAFALGTAMAAHVYLPWGVNDLIRSREFICFAVLCFMNITAIDLWERTARTHDEEVRAGAELSISLPLTLLGAASLVFALLDHEMATRPFFYAILTSAALLQVLNRTRQRFQIDTLRVLADVALLLPVGVFLAFPAG